MKKLLLITAIIFSINSYSQLKVVENEPTEEIGKITNMNELVIEAKKQGETYIFNYKDEKFMHIDEYKTFFLQGKEDFESLYTIILDNMDKQPDEPIMLELEEGYLFLKFGKTFGSPYVNIGHVLDQNGDVVGFTQWLNKRKLDKLFGK